jgi:ssDNA-binding Zn-finger/Zn-ribbon topoisomerase 1
MKSKCPLCQAELVLKLGRKGMFMGCTNFPQCYGSRSIDGTATQTKKPSMYEQWEIDYWNSLGPDPGCMK